MFKNYPTTVGKWKCFFYVFCTAPVSSPFCVDVCRFITILVKSDVCSISETMMWIFLNWLACEILRCDTHRENKDGCDCYGDVYIIPFRSGRRLGVDLIDLFIDNPQYSSKDENQVENDENKHSILVTMKPDGSYFFQIKFYEADEVRP